MNAEEYWDKREKERYTVEQMNDSLVNLRTRTIITGHFGRMVESLESFYQRYADGEGITLAEAKKRISEVDMGRYEALAEYYVKNRDDKGLTRSKEADAQMKLYNVTMKTNREKLLMAEMAQHMKNMGYEVQSEMKKYLDESTIREFERQAGILGSINVSQTQFNAIINSTHLDDSVNWDERLWTNLKEVQKEVDKAIHDSLIRGIHPDKAVKRLRELTGRSEYEARRLLLTEVTRAQSEASLLSFTEKKIKSFIFYAQLDNRTTRECKGMHKEVVLLKDAKIGLNVPPLHQFCRSAVAPYITPESVIEEGGGVFNIFNDDEEFDEDDNFDDEFDEGEDLLDELDGLLDKIEAKQGKQKVKPEVKKKIDKVIEEIPEEVDPFEPVMNPMIRNFLNDEHYEGVYNQLKNAQDPRAIQLFNANTQEVGLKTKANGAHYWVVDNSVTMEMSQYGYGVHGNHESEYSRTFFHEYGHAIDAEFVRRSKEGNKDSNGRIRHMSYSISQTFKGSNDKTLEQTMQDEWKAYEKAVQKRLAPDYKDLMGRNMTIADTRRWIVSEFRKSDEYLWQDISDMIEGATLGKVQLGWGHGKAYWQRGNHPLSMEIFAELYSLMVTSREAYNFTKEHIPETVAVFEELVQYMLDEEEKR